MAKDKGKKDEPEDEADDGTPDGHIPIRIADHPRARRSIARVRAWGALIGFGLAAYLGNKAGLPFVDLVLRSIGIGMASYLVAWAGAQAVWKQIVFAELAVRRRDVAETQQALLDKLEEAAKEQRPGQG